MSFNCRADNTQLYIHCKLSEPAKLSSLHNCLVAVETWTAGNFLQLQIQQTGNPHFSPFAHFSFFFNFCPLVALLSSHASAGVKGASEFMYQTVISTFVMTFEIRQN